MHLHKPGGLKIHRLLHQETIPVLVNLLIGDYCGERSLALLDESMLLVNSSSMDAPPQEKICILATIYPTYSWLMPILVDCIDYFWPHHPEIRFTGLQTSDMISNAAGNINWVAMVKAGVERIKKEGFQLAYLIAEEHIPVNRCHTHHLNKTLPRLMQELPAVYISLMGWDNRRFPSKSPVLGKQYYRFKHLAGSRDPRFHLHPALWRVDVLEHCCQVASEDVSKNGSAWHFEKSNDKLHAKLPDAWKGQCYQLCAAEMRWKPLNSMEIFLRGLERFWFLKWMALYPLIPQRKVADAYFRAVGFDRFVCDGPYPMVFSGALVKGKLNPTLKNGLCSTEFGRKVYHRIAAQMQSAHSSCALHERQSLRSSSKCY